MSCWAGAFRWERSVRWWGRSARGGRRWRMSFLARITQAGQVAAWVDVSGDFDAESAAANGVALQRVLWVGCGGEQREYDSAGRRQPRRWLGVRNGAVRGGGGWHPRSEARGVDRAMEELLGNVRYDKQFSAGAEAEEGMRAACAEMVRKERPVKKVYEQTARAGNEDKGGARFGQAVGEVGAGAPGDRPADAGGRVRGGGAGYGRSGGGVRGAGAAGDVVPVSRGGGAHANVPAAAGAARLREEQRGSGAAHGRGARNRGHGAGIQWFELCGRDVEAAVCGRYGKEASAEGVRGEVEERRAVDGRVNSELYACLHVAEFPAQARLRLRPELREKAVAVIEGEAPFERVCAANERAARSGDLCAG